MCVCSANLSESYFTDRQDRYMMFEQCPSIANFFSNLVKSVASMSFKLASDDQVSLPTDLNVHPFLGMF